MSALDAGEIIRAAGYTTGHFDVLEPSFAVRLSKVTDWLHTHGGLTAAELTVARHQLLNIVITRVRLAADRRRIPAIAEERIERPIFVIGYSRTGTTLLQSLLAEDPGNQAPLWWHTHQPSPPPGEVPVARGRLETARRELERMLDTAPGMLTMHPYWDRWNEALIEDEEIHTLDFHNIYPTLLYAIPAFPVMGASESPALAYHFQKEFLQHLQWNTPRRRWVVKGCFHQFNLKQLFAEFPDACCVWPHREPLAVHASALAITAVLYGGISQGKMDWRAFAASYLQGVRQAITAVLADPLIDDPRILHVRFKELAKDPIATIRRLYELAQCSLSAQFEQKMRGWLADPGNQPDRYGRYPYSLEPFGLKPEDVVTAFAPYSKRFGLS